MRLSGLQQPPIKNQLILVGNNTGMRVVLPKVIAPLTLSFQDEQFAERLA